MSQAPQLIRAKPIAYVEGLLREIEQLKARDHRVSEQAAEINNSVIDFDQPLDAIDEASQPSQNPLLDEQPWFLPVHSSKVPILIGEVADAVFATRLRQLITGKTLSHIPRVTYPGHDQILELAKTEIPQPQPSRARFLLRVALEYLEGSFHIVRKSLVCALLEKYLHAPQSLDSLSTCKIFALLALGELHSNRFQNQEAQIAGLAYCSHASRAHGLLEERPSLDSIEVSLILCLYALCINRRHSAYFLASSAIRRAVVMGLHFDFPNPHLNDPELKEHIKRLWWTSYVLDHLCASISSQLVSISDNDIFVDLSFTPDVAHERQSDFAHTEWFLARVHLARITRKTVESVYDRRQKKESFLQRVQYALRDLKQWLNDLPRDIQMGTQPSHLKPRPIQSLHLTFNQSVILATRPVLLHKLRMHKDSNRETPTETDQIVSSNVQSLAEACIRCARHSYSTIVESWIEGNFGTFDYFNTRNLFSAATVLAISCLLGGPGGAKDYEDFEFAGELLEKLRDSGSFTAMEFCRHVEELNADIRSFWSGLPGTEAQSFQHDITSATTYPTQEEHFLQPRYLMTSDMALAEPSIEAFLQSEQSLTQLNAFWDHTGQEGLYWPTGDIF
ncbi:hypothetical protein BO79DRAFT_247035 [Aspergillus costaricaensis CBS 115574]|uniref:Uncharacterized protein n=1 Tax=Aspergillus costaricaensis CBS 115574 TaxID=1448317 RepID=A0ACD1I7A3_9EURO|nr:hypothetical protein BO79DRAFT_247035 [Aspergillus costaricaensis CBS 115574]RAK86385.1 hypothetical protein BO79DRAFT_247035 [Aspergillus costaricaensis CBS 115574]